MAIIKVSLSSTAEAVTVSGAVSGPQVSVAEAECRCQSYCQLN